MTQQDQSLSNPLHEAFQIFSQGAPEITSTTLEMVLRGLGHHPSEKDIVELIREVDEDNSNTVNLDEFCNMMTKMLQDSDSEEQVKEAFRLLSIHCNNNPSSGEGMVGEGDSYIRNEDLRRALSTLGEMSQLDIDALLMVADDEKEGVVHFDRFVKRMISGEN